MLRPSAALLLAALLSAADVRADAPFLLTWDAPPGCPDVQSVRARVESLIAGAPEALLDEPLTVSGAVAVTDVGAELRLTTNHGGIQGERRLEGATCEEVTSAGSLVIALSIDPNASEHRANGSGPTAAFEHPTDEQRRPAEANPPPASTASPVSPPVRSVAGTPEDEPPKPRDRSDAAFAPALSGVFDTAALPRAAFGIGGGIWYGNDRWRFGAEGGYLPPLVAEAEGYPGKGGEIALVFFGATACWTPIGRNTTVGACGFAEGGALLAGGRGLEHKNQEEEPWLALGGAAAFWLRPGGPIGLGLRVGPIFPMGRARFGFVADDGQRVEVHRPSLVGLRAALGVDWEFR